MSERTNARDEWRAAGLGTDGVLATAAASLAVARARFNHSAAEGGSYQ